MIYLLDEDPAECAKMLDDISLSKQIRAVARTLCDVHHYYMIDNCQTFDDVSNRDRNSIPIPKTFYGTVLTGWLDWGYTCRANYLQLVEMGLACCEEWQYRFSNSKITTTYKLKTGEKSEKVEYDFRHKYQSVIEWANDNIPNLPE